MPRTKRVIAITVHFHIYPRGTSLFVWYEHEQEDGVHNFNREHRNLSVQSSFRLFRFIRRQLLSGNANQTLSLSGLTLYLDKRKAA